MKNHEVIENKVLCGNALEEHVNDWKSRGKRIVFTNGVFDLLHLGHIDYLSKARDLGDILVVGVNTDQSVRRLNKGSSRPITNEKSRSRLLASMFFVDAVVLFDEDTPYELISRVVPDILVKGSDYKPEDIVGADIVMAHGGEIKTIDFLEGYSTSSIEKHILATHKG